MPRQSKMKIFGFSFSIALTLHYLCIRQASARQSKMKIFGFSFSIALTLHYLCPAKTAKRKFRCKWGRYEQASASVMETASARHQSHNSCCACGKWLASTAKDAHVSRLQKQIAWSIYPKAWSIYPKAWGK